MPPAIMSPAESVDSVKFVSSMPSYQPRSDDWSLATRIAIASITSQGTMGGLIVAGFVSTLYKTSTVNTEDFMNNFIRRFLILDVKDNWLETHSHNRCYIRCFIYVRTINVD